MFSYITRSIIPIIVLIIITYGMIKGRKVYEWFIEGAKEGLKVCVNIFPYLLDMLNNAVSPLCKLIDLPKEIVPLVLIKPLSGSGAMGVFTDILKSYGADSPIGLVASVIMGTTETIFYTITVYFGAVKIKKTRHTVWAAIMADMTAIIMAILMVKNFIL